MSILTREAQDKVVKLLVGEGLVSAEAVQAAQQEVQQSKQPILALLTAKKLVDDETVAHATAVVIGVPYVSLRNVKWSRSSCRFCRETCWNALWWCH